MEPQQGHPELENRTRELIQAANNKMKRYNKKPKQPNALSNNQVLASEWLRQHIASDLKLSDQDLAGPDLFSALLTMLMGHMEDPDMDYALAVLRSRGVAPDVGSKFMASFGSRVSDYGIDLFKVREKADTKWANSNLHCWAEFTLRRTLEWVEIYLLNSTLLCNPRILTHVTNALIGHLIDKDQARTLLRLRDLGCSGDVSGLIMAFEQAWRKQVYRVTQSSLTPGERALNDMIHEAIFQSPYFKEAHDRPV